MRLALRGDGTLRDGGRWSLGAYRARRGWGRLSCGFFCRCLCTDFEPVGGPFPHRTLRAGTQNDAHVPAGRHFKALVGGAHYVQDVLGGTCRHQHILGASQHIQGNVDAAELGGAPLGQHKLALGHLVVHGDFGEHVAHHADGIRQHVVEVVRGGGVRFHKLAVPQVHQQIPVGRDGADGVGQLEGQGRHPARCVERLRVEPVELEVGVVRDEFGGRVDDARDTGNEAAATHVDGAGHGDDGADVFGVRQPGVDESQQPAHAPAHDGEFLHPAVFTHRLQGLGHHAVGIVLHAQRGMAALGCAPVDQVGLEPAGCHVAHQTAVGHQVKGLGRHPQRWHQHQRYRLLFLLNCEHFTVVQGNFVFVEVVEAHRHRVAGVDDGVGRFTRLDQTFFVEQPVEGIDGGGRYALVDFRAFVHPAFEGVVHGRSDRGLPGRERRMIRGCRKYC